MNTKFWGKRQLYQCMDELRLYLHVSPADLHIDSKRLAFRFIKNPQIEEIPFPSMKICGILYRGASSTSIALNANRTPAMQNFDCMHEVVHYFIHDIQHCQRICCDERGNAGRIEQDTYIEWQANEGAAQFLLPYQLFIPDYIKTSRECARNLFPALDAETLLSEKYFVSPKVVHNRINSLNYEIYQYMHGIPIEKVDIRSKSYLRDQCWNLNHARLYCKNCLSPLWKNDKYCRVCGKIAYDRHALHRLGFTGKGAGYMVYEGHPQDEQGRIIKCPICKNEQPYKEGEYCIICGSSLVNRCADTDIVEDGYDSRKRSCNVERILPGNARFCPYCGNKTIFFQQKFLSPWNANTEPRAAFSDPAPKCDDTFPF